MKIEFPDSAPGIHPPTAAITRILNFKQVNNPHTEKPYSEALLLGIGGGLDIGYILYQFNHLPNPMLLLGFRNRWNFTRAFIETLTGRLQLKVKFQEFDEQRTAQKALQNAIKQNKPVVAWVDKALLHYHRMPESLRGYIEHVVTVYGRDGRLWRLFIDDLTAQPIEVKEKEFTSARASLSQNNCLIMVYEKNGHLDAQGLREAIRHGIQDCAIQLTRPMKTIGISNLDNWAEKLTNQNDPQGWPQVFKNPIGLFTTLGTIYESIKLNGTGGFALRKLYSDFLQESAAILNNAALNAVAGQYLQISNHWSVLAENALPSQIPDFDRVKNLLNSKYQAYRQNNQTTCKKAATDLQTIETKLTKEFPLSRDKTLQLFDRLSSQVKLIAELELSAVSRLQDVTRREI